MSLLSSLQENNICTLNGKSQNMMNVLHCNSDRTNREMKGINSQILSLKKSSQNHEVLFDMTHIGGCSKTNIVDKSMICIKDMTTKVMKNLRVMSPRSEKLEDLNITIIKIEILCLRT